VRALPEELDALRDAIRRDGGGAETLTLDITDVASTMAALESCPPFDILVNNAGTNRIAPFTQVGLGDFDAVFALNVKASYFVAQSVARRLMAAGRTGASGAKQPSMRKQNILEDDRE
jgi:NAD(P)-dependent dehydrogenase (short-subunit alcohol dehydrogenase family)